MKKLKIWSILLLAVMTMPLEVSCGGDDGEKEESDYEKFFRLANIKEENYESIYIYKNSYSSSELINENSHYEFAGFERGSENFHFWLFDKKNNKIYEYKDVIKKSYQVHEGYGVYKDYSLSSIYPQYADSRVGTVCKLGLLYSDSTEMGKNGGAAIHLLLNNNGQFVLLNEFEFMRYDQTDRCDFYTKDWYNNSLAFIYPHDKPITTSGLYEYIAKAVIINNEGQLVKTLPIGVDIFKNNFALVYDYDKAVSWSYNWTEKELKFCFLDLNEEIKPERAFDIKIPFDDFTFIDCIYDYEIISSDSRYCTFRITETSYQGEKGNVVIKVDKQDKTVEIVN